MHLTHVRRLDLNLLVRLHALLTEQSVSRAAVHVGITQSAMSRALARLRDHFDDPLLVRSGSGMRKTARASALQAPLERLLADAEFLLADEQDFNPLTTDRAFTVALGSHIQVSLLPLLLPLFSAAAPRATLRIVEPSPLQLPSLAEGQVDLAVFPHRANEASTLVRKQLLHERFVALVSKTQWGDIETLCLHTFARGEHVLVAPLGGVRGAVDDALTTLGLTRRVALVLPSFGLAGLNLSTGPRIVTLPVRTAETLTGANPDLRVLELPPELDLDGVSTWVHWHERYRRSAAHIWLRRLVMTTGRQLGGSVPPSPPSLSEGHATVADPLDSGTQSRPANVESP